MKMLETIHILPVRAESAAPAPLRGKKLDQRAATNSIRASSHASSKSSSPR